MINNNGHHYLIECGLIQEAHTVLENYKRNRDYIRKIKSGEIEFVIVGHLHADHIAMIPALFNNPNCKARIIVPAKSTLIMREMLLDCAYINQRDTEYLSLKQGKNIPPLYTENEVFRAMEHVEEYESGAIVELSPELSIRYTPAGHIMLSQQMELYLKNNGHIKKLLFTSDLGNTITQNNKFYMENFQPVSTAELAFVECTYAARNRTMTLQDYQKDLMKIKTVITQYCINSNNRILIPTFSLDRCPYFLWILYNLFGDDESFDVPIVVDSPLTIRLLHIYSSILEDNKKEMFDQMLKWKNLRLIVEPEESKAAIADKGRKVILSSSGMLTAGRSIKWTQSILPRENDCILFCGYSGENTLAWKIKHANEQKTISINGTPVKNRCQIVDLKSFSSHMQREQLINYYKSIRCEKLYLIHGNGKDKLDFKHDLEKAINDCLKTTKVVAVNKGMKISL